MKNPRHRHVTSMVAWLGLLLTTAACSASDSEPAAVATGSLVRTTNRAQPGLIPPVALDIARSIATRMEQLHVQPASNTDIDWTNQGGLLTTNDSGLSERDLVAPQLQASRNLDIYLDGTDEEGGNELELIASAPVDDQSLSRIIINFTFSDRNPLNSGTLSGHLISAALKPENAGSLTVTSVTAQPSVPVNSDRANTVYWDAKGTRFTGIGASGDPTPLASNDVTAVVTRSKTVWKFLDSAFERMNSAVNHPARSTFYGKWFVHGAQYEFKPSGISTGEIALGQVTEHDEFQVRPTADGRGLVVTVEKQSWSQLDSSGQEVAVSDPAPDETLKLGDKFMVSFTRPDVLRAAADPGNKGKSGFGNPFLCRVGTTTPDCGA